MMHEVIYRMIRYSGNDIRRVNHAIKVYGFASTIGRAEMLSSETRICFLIGHHHTYTKIDGPDFQILVEADFPVNIDEDKHGINRSGYSSKGTEA
jgi:hypothetical protein